MRILVLNPNTSELITERLASAARKRLHRTPLLFL